MDHNLIPPFMLREMGVTVNDVPKIHKEDPTVDDHAITFAEMGFRIPLSLWGIFSYFPTSKPTHDDLLNPNEVYILSPATWNPHSDADSANEESMLDWEGNMQPKKDCQHWIVLDDVEDNVNMVASLSITPLEQEAIDTHLIEDDEQFIPRSDVSSTLGSDKGFLYVVPMCRKSEVLQALKQIAKEIGAPTSIIADMSGEQMSHDVRKFCNDIGTTLCALEEGTPWSNKAELYIGLLKEAVRKDMRI